MVNNFFSLQCNCSISVDMMSLDIVPPHNRFTLQIYIFYLNLPSFFPIFLEKTQKIHFRAHTMSLYPDTLFCYFNGENEA